MDLLIKNGFVVDPSQKIATKKDLLIQNGKIAEILKPNSYKKPVGRTLDVKDCIVTPGFIDIHTHLREPGQSHKESITTGTQAAAAGGFTSVVAMANTIPPNDRAQSTYALLHKIRSSAVVNVFPVGALTKKMAGEELTDFYALKEAGCIAISDDGQMLLNAKLLNQALQIGKVLGLVIISHAEDRHLVSDGVLHEGKVSQSWGVPGNLAVAEEVAVLRDIALAQNTGGSLHFAHLSTARALERVRAAKKQGVPITAEVTPHHLFLSVDDIPPFDTDFKMAPPLRTRSDCLALEQGIEQGSIDCFATDHAPHTPSEKKQDFRAAPFGVIGLETALPLTYRLVEQKKLTLSQFIERWTTRPAQILSLKKGTLQKGRDADITIFHPKQNFRIQKKTFYSKSRNTPFEGWPCRAKVCYTIVGGKIVYKI